MLNCSYCDYIKKIRFSETSDNDIWKCRFTGVVFSGNIDEMDMEPPCSTMSFQTYLIRNQKH